ncbi:MAG: NDP-sugar synthase [Candidatus Bathyarchaeia archaeon]
MIKAVILAGGLGTRLRPLTYTRLKPMLPVVQKPILHHLISSLAAQGFNEIIVTTNRKDQRVQEHFGDGTQYNTHLTYAYEEYPLGTAGAVKNVQNQLDESFAIIQGDNITEISFVEQMKFHKLKGGKATIAVKEVDTPWLYGIVELDKNRRIQRFLEKPTPEKCFSNLVSTGLYVLEPEVLDYVPLGREYDFAKDLFPRLLRDNVPIYGYVTDAFWVDIGNPDGYMEGTRYILSKLTNNISETAEIKNVSIIGNAWIEENVKIGAGTRIIGPAYIERNTVVKNEAFIGPGTVIKEKTSIGAKARLYGAVIYEQTIIDEKAILGKCIVAENCRIGKEAIIDDYAIIGANCKIGDKTHIYERSKIWPKIVINPGATIAGIIEGVTNT